MKYFIIFIMVFLVGCSTVPSSPLTRKIDIDPRISEATCGPLFKLTEKDFQHELEVTILNAKLYAECSKKLDSATELLRKISKND